MWAKWRAQGDVGTMDDAIARDLYNKGDLEIKAVGKCHEGPWGGYSTLSIGEKALYEGSSSNVTEPALCVRAPGFDYHEGQKLDKLPKGYVSFRN